MEIFQKYKKVFLFVGIFIAVVIVYEMFFAGGGTPPAPSGALSPTRGGLVSELSVSPADAILGQQLLTMLGRLQFISLNPSIFNDPIFRSFQDWSRPIEPQPFGKTLGRRNPFSAFGLSGGAPAGEAAPKPPSAMPAGAPVGGNGAR